MAHTLGSVIVQVPVNPYHSMVLLLHRRQEALEPNDGLKDLISCFSNLSLCMLIKAVKKISSVVFMISFSING